MQISPGQTNEKFSDSSGLSSIIFRNTTYVTFGNLILKLLNFLFSIYVIRSLGDARFGQYSIVLGFVGLIQIVAELGISQFIMREISRDKSLAKEYFWNLVGTAFSTCHFRNSCNYSSRQRNWLFTPAHFWDFPLFSYFHSSGFYCTNQLPVDST